MEDHIMDAEKAELLEEDSRYSIISREELMARVEQDGKVLDIGSGTGFFTDDLAVKAEKVYAVDFQEGMHDYYRGKGVPGNVELVHSRASEIKLDEEVDLIVSILSLHEIDLERTLEKFEEVLSDDGKILVVDWSRNAETEDIPPKEKLFSAEDAEKAFSRFFSVEEYGERRDTFLLVAEK